MLHVLVRDRRVDGDGTSSMLGYQHGRQTVFHIASRAQRERGTKLKTVFKSSRTKDFDVCFDGRGVVKAMVLVIIFILRKSFYLI